MALWSGFLDILSFFALSKHLFMVKYVYTVYINIIPSRIATYNHFHLVTGHSQTKMLRQKVFSNVAGQRTSADLTGCIIFSDLLSHSSVINFFRRLLNFSSLTIWVIRCSCWLYKFQLVSQQIKHWYRPSTVWPNIECIVKIFIRFKGIRFT